MKIRFSREYEINYEGTAADFIALVDKELRFRSDEGLDSLDMGDAVHAAANLCDAGYLIGVITPTLNTEYHYDDCPDSLTVLDYDPDTDTYRVSAFQCQCKVNNGECLNMLSSDKITAHVNRFCDDCIKLGHVIL